MIALPHLWLPILVSAVGVFIASSIVHMVLKFWHQPDFHAVPNEDDVASALRKGSPAPGMYLMPYCPMEDMKKPETREKFKLGPVAYLILRENGMPNLGKSLLQWFVLLLVISIFTGYVSGIVLAAGTDWMRVFRITGTVAFMAYGFFSLPAGIWWGQPWRAVAKDVVDGAIYALVTGVLFACLWPG